MTGVRAGVRRLLLGNGRFSAATHRELIGEGTLLVVEELRASFILRHYRAPRAYANYRRDAAHVAMAVTRHRLVVHARQRPLIDVPFADPRWAGVQIADRDGRLVIAADAAVFNPHASGLIELRIRLADPAAVGRVIGAAATQPRDVSD